jgi:hypothetical protein
MKTKVPNGLMHTLLVFHVLPNSFAGSNKDFRFDMSLELVVGHKFPRRFCLAFFGNLSENQRLSLPHNHGLAQLVL